MKKKVAINGFGRIGRAVLKCVLNDPECSKLDIVAINDLTDSATLAHLFKYDSVQGVTSLAVQANSEGLIVDGKHIKITSQRDPAQLPWKELGIDFVIESTGLFTNRDAAEKHLQAGAKKVIISAPANKPDATIVLGVNEKTYNSIDHNIISNASCTTNCLAPLVKVLNEKFILKKGLMTTIHSYTNDQKILDLPHSDLRRARAANLSMIPTTTGAAKAVTLVLPEVRGKLDGMAIRVPTPNVSIIDLVLDVEKNTTAEEVNNTLREVSQGDLLNIMRFEEKPLVSVDFNGDPCSSIIDGLSTKVMDGNMLKVLAWYDNEWGYSNRVKDLLKYVALR